MKKKSDPCQRATKQYNKGDHDGALENLKKCTKQLNKMLREQGADKQKIRFQLARIHNFEGMVALQVRKLKRSNSALEKAKTILGKLPETREGDQLLGEIFYSQGLISIFQNNPVIEHFVMSREAFLSAKNYESAIKVMTQLADFTDDLSKRREKYIEIRKLSKKIKDKQQKKITSAMTYFAEGKILMELKDKDARSILEKAKKEYSKLKHDEGMAESMIELAALEEEEDAGKAEELLLEALDLARVKENKKLLGIVLTKLGVMSLKSGDFEKGKKRLLKGLQYRTEAGDKAGSAKTIMELARISLISARNNDDYKNAEYLANQSLQLYKEVGDEYSQGMVHELVSTVYTRTGEYEKAVKHARIGRKLFGKFDDKAAEARILAQLGVALDGSGEHDEVMPTFNKAIKLFGDLNSETGVAEVSYLAGLHLARNDVAQSMQYLTRSRDVYEKYKEVSSEMEMMHNLVNKKIDELNTK